MSIFKRFRSPEDAARAVGASVEFEGHTYTCVGHNDLGCLYWQRADWKQKSVYGEQLDAAAGFPQS
jgi:hypothetical protein